MKVITTNPIIEEKDFHEEDFVNLFGKKAQRRRESRRRGRDRKRSSKDARRAQKQRSRQQRGGGFLDKAGNFIQGISNSGVLNSLGQGGFGGGMGGFNDGMGGFNDGMGGFNDPMMNNTMNTNFNQRQGLSRGAKIAIGVGVAALVGFGIYYATKGKGKAKKAPKK